MALRSAPINSILNFLSVPSSSNARAVFNPVCPPIVGSKTILSFGCNDISFSIILATMSGVIGSIYVASAMSGSVMIVAGFEFTSMTLYPSSLSALHACAPE